MKDEVQELRKGKEGLEKELKKAQENESQEQSSVIHISTELNKLQVSYASLIDIKGTYHPYIWIQNCTNKLSAGENVKLLKKVKSYEKQIYDLTRVKIILIVSTLTNF